jgi:hypothetical protein
MSKFLRQNKSTTALNKEKYNLIYLQDKAEKRDSLGYANFGENKVLNWNVTTDNLHFPQFLVFSVCTYKLSPELDKNGGGIHLKLAFSKKTRESCNGLSDRDLYVTNIYVALKGTMVNDFTTVSRI